VAFLASDQARNRAENGRDEPNQRYGGKGAGPQAAAVDAKVKRLFESAS